MSVLYSLLLEQHPLLCQSVMRTSVVSIYGNIWIVVKWLSCSFSHSVVYCSSVLRKRWILVTTLLMQPASTHARSPETVMPKLFHFVAYPLVNQETRVSLKHRRMQCVMVQLVIVVTIELHVQMALSIARYMHLQHQMKQLVNSQIRFHQRPSDPFKPFVSSRIQQFLWLERATDATQIWVVFM